MEQSSDLRPQYSSTSLNNIKTLIASPSPRDIPEFYQGLKTIPSDKLLVKYHHPKRAYKIIREYFLNESDADYLIIHPDDLIADISHYNKLKDDIEKQDFQVLSGVCNVDSKSRTNLLACVNTKFPTLRRNIRSYNFMNMSDIGKGIMNMQWVGFPFMWARRDVIEKIEFEDDSKWNMNSPNMGWGFDIVFCHNCHELGIPIYADTDVFMKHHKGIRSNKILTGYVSPKIILVKNNISYDITDECNSRYLTKDDWKKYPHMNSTTGTTDMI